MNTNPGGTMHKFATTVAVALAAALVAVVGIQAPAHAAANGVQLSKSNTSTAGQLMVTKYLKVWCDSGATHILVAPDMSPCFKTEYFQGWSPNGTPIATMCYCNGQWTLLGQARQWVGWRTDTVNVRLYIP
jgi:hypothetical protein